MKTIYLIVITVLLFGCKADVPKPAHAPEPNCPWIKSEGEAKKFYCNVEYGGRDLKEQGPPGTDAVFKKAIYTGLYNRTSRLKDFKEYELDGTDAIGKRAQFAGTYDGISMGMSKFNIVNNNYMYLELTKNTKAALRKLVSEQFALVDFVITEIGQNGPRGYPFTIKPLEPPY